MDEPIPILQGNPSPAEARLLGSADLDLPPRDGAARVLLALGVGATSVMAAGHAAAQLSGSGAVGGTAAAASATAPGMGMLFAKYVALGAAIGASVTGTGEIVRTGLSGPNHERVAGDVAPARNEPVREQRVSKGSAERAARALAPAATFEEILHDAPPAAAPPVAPRREAAQEPPHAESGVARDVPAPSSSLTDEVRALDDARVLLARGEAIRSLGTLDGFARQFPAPRLGLEADLLRVEVLIALGRTREARALGGRLLRNGEGPHTRRLRSLLEQSGGVP